MELWRKDQKWDLVVEAEMSEDDAFKLLEDWLVAEMHKTRHGATGLKNGFLTSDHLFEAPGAGDTSTRFRAAFPTYTATFRALPSPSCWLHVRLNEGRYDAPQNSLDCHTCTFSPNVHHPV